MERENYKEVPRDVDPAEALIQFPEFIHAAHVMLYCKWPGQLFGKYEYKAMTMMQLRFDGMLGFPGGVVDKGETPQQAVTREFKEEVGCDDGLVTITTADHICTHYSHHTQMCLHFFAKEVTRDIYLSLEKSPLTAKDWGKEVFGVIRVPLYTLPNGLGLPGFLKNAFIGNSLMQLGLGLTRGGLLTEGEWAEALSTSGHVTGLVTKEEIDY